MDGGGWGRFPLRGGVDRILVGRKEGMPQGLKPLLSLGGGGPRLKPWASQMQRANARANAKGNGKGRGKG